MFIRNGKAAGSIHHAKLAAALNPKSTEQPADTAPAEPPVDTEPEIVDPVPPEPVKRSPGRPPKGTS